MPIVNHSECRVLYRAVGIDIDDSQLCAGGIAGEDSCRGDSGGALMKLQGDNWFVEGIVSFGNKCGLAGWPGVYTRVSSFEDWIKSNLRP